MSSDVKNQILKTKLMTAIKLLASSSPKVQEALSALNSTLELLNCNDLGPVLMVERDSAILELVKEALHEDGIEIYGVQNADEAADLMRHMNQRDTPFQVAILALGSDSGGALSVYHLLRSFCPNAKVILASGNLAETSMLTAEGHDFWATLPKPYKMSALKTLIFSAFSSVKV